MRITSILLKVKTLLFDWKSWLSVISTKWVLIFISFQIAILVVAFIAFGLLPVHREAMSISKELTRKQSQSQNTQTQSSTNLAHRLIAAKHHEAFLTSNLQLSKADSISLLIDLPDSLVILTFKGVYLFKSKISTIKFNKGFEKLPLYLSDSLFSGPFKVEKEISTFDKFPIVIKKAPKDTLEASLASSAPEPPKQTDAFWFFTFSNSLAVEIRQQEDNLVGTRSAYRNYKNAKAEWLRRNALSGIFEPDQKVYTYQFSIEIPREDARSIYRALPTKPMVIVRYSQSKKDHI